jgi:low affinity Fe/Cu permease
MKRLADKLKKVKAEKWVFVLTLIIIMCIFLLWGWLEGYSDQIQIAIAISAIGLAVVGFFKINEQIKTSNEQRLFALQLEVTRQMVELKKIRLDEFQIRSQIIGELQLVIDYYKDKNNEKLNEYILLKQ